MDSSELRWTHSARDLEAVYTILVMALMLPRFLKSEIPRTVASEIR